MKITILTLFPDMFTGFTSQSIIKRAIDKGLVSFYMVNIRDYTTDRYGRVDTPPIGGGAGLVMKAQPFVSALNAVSSEHTHKVLLAPTGKPFTQTEAHRLSNKDELLFACGHYEGIDARVEPYFDEQISLGDFILTGGELGAMVISDAIIRLIPGAIETTSLDLESFDDGLLEYPQYTEPYEFEGEKVPSLLYSGHHEAINKWRRLMRLVTTRELRPDLFAKYKLTKQDKKLLDDHDAGIHPKWLLEAINNGHKFMKE
ncbi:MAG TPA: tRNA (guanosine(37)-N1)-methyltransferase TrmD [Firmicutes bacterium]|nr:tRNA (guanosine(37)-N1)-methyltransferase TrmD [Bacillota bacterium]